jgi:hypothetical protein
MEKHITPAVERTETANNAVPAARWHRGLA